MPKVRIPFVGGAKPRDYQQASQTEELSALDQEFYNCAFQVYTSEPQSAKVLLCHAEVPQGQQRVVDNSATSYGTAIKVWTGQDQNIITAFGQTNSVVYLTTNPASPGTPQGTTTGLVTFLSETVGANGTTVETPTLCAVTDSNRAYWFTPSTALTEVTDVDFPAKQTPARTVTGNFVHIDGYAVIACRDGTVWQSDQNSVVNWTANAYFTANRVPQRLVGVVKYRNYLCVGGNAGIEFWYNAGNTVGSVFSRVEGGFIPQGVLNQYCLIPFMDTVAFVGVSPGHGVFILDGFQARKISTKGLDSIIAINPTNIRLHSFMQWGQPVLVLTYEALGTTNQAWVWHPHVNLWTRFEAWQFVSQTDTSSAQVKAYSVNYRADDVARYFETTSTADTGITIRLPVFDAGNARVRKTCNSIGLVAQSDKTVTGYLGWNDADGAVTNNQVRPIKITQDVNGQAPVMRRCGTFRRRSFYVNAVASFTLNGENAVYEGLDVDYDVAPH